MLSDELFLEYEPVESESATTKNYDCTNYDANDCTCAETVVIVGSLRIVIAGYVGAGNICAGIIGFGSVVGKFFNTFNGDDLICGNVCNYVISACLGKLNAVCFYLEVSTFSVVTGYGNYKVEVLALNNGGCVTCRYCGSKACASRRANASGLFSSIAARPSASPALL